MAIKSLEKYNFIRKDYYLQVKIICPICKKERWVKKQTIEKSKNFTGNCGSCNGRLNMKKNTKSKPIDLDRVKNKIGMTFKWQRKKRIGSLGAFVVCPICKKERWVTEHNILVSKNWTSRCSHCNSLKGEQNGNWKGGRVKTPVGYIHLYLKKNNPFYSMAGKTHYVFEHRYVIAKKLKRLLSKYEIVHHKNGVKDDNRIENLELIGGKKAQLKHNIITMQQRKIEELEGELLKLKKNL